MYVGHAVLFSECISDAEVSRVVLLACRNEVIVDQNDLVRIPQLFKAHFFKFFSHERNKNVVDHDAVHIYDRDIARLYGLSGIMFNDFLNYCLSHCILPL